MQDTIVREITVSAPKERVYSAITDPKEIIKWFPDKVDGSLDVGERPIFTFNGHGTSQIYVVAAKPTNYFAYRWVPGDAAIEGDVLKVANTLVEFFLEEAKNGTKVTMKESGFASLPAEVAERCFGMNSEGWNYMLARLEKELNKGL